jgi:hypothetical protein
MFGRYGFKAEQIHQKPPGGGDSMSTPKLDANGNPLPQAPGTPPHTGGVPKTAAPGLLSPTPAPPVPDYSVATKVSEITSKNSPLMQQAQTAGAKYANKRGLLNSSLAGEAAQEAVLKAATPIASQDSAQEHALQLAGMNLAANERDRAQAAAVSYEQIYSNSFAAIMQNENIPKDTRDKYIVHQGKLRDSNMALLEQIYNVDLTWASPTP